MSNLIKFEGFNVEYVLKSDVNFEFEGDVLFHGNQSAELLGYSNPHKALDDHVEGEMKYHITKEKLNNKSLVSLGQRGNWFITEDGVIDLTYKSKLPKAKDFRKKVREIIKQVQQTGRYDVVENNITKIEDDKEKQLQMKVYKLQQVYEVDPTDRLTAIMLNDAEKELKLYKQEMEIETVKQDVKELQGKVNRATVIREGDMTAEVIAKRLNIFSINNKPHINFAECVAKDLGIYIKPSGNVGYQDEYITINLTQKGGRDVPTLKYSETAFKEIEKYMEEGNYYIDEPPLYFKRGKKKGVYNYTYMNFGNDENRIKINETTYKMYSDKYI